MSKHVTIALNAARYADHDDALSAAAKAVGTALRCKNYDMAPRYSDDQREYILVDVPAWAAAPTLIDRLAATITNG